MLHQASLIALPLTLPLSLAFALTSATPAFAGDNTSSTGAAKPAASSGASTNAGSGVQLRPVDDKTFHDIVLKPRAGKAVLVSFWASYCVPCLAELPHLIAMKSDVQKAGGDIVLVNVDPPGHPGDVVKALHAKGIDKLESLQVSNEDPQPFIDMIDKKWAGEVPFAAVYGKDGTLKLTLEGEQKPDDLKKAVDGALH